MFCFGGSWRHSDKKCYQEQFKSIHANKLLVNKKRFEPQADLCKVQIPKKSSKIIK